MTSTDEREGLALLGPLQGEPPAASRVDVGESMRAGRRLRRRRRAGIATAAAAVVAGVAVTMTTPALIAKNRTISDMPAGGGAVTGGPGPNGAVTGGPVPSGLVSGGPVPTSPQVRAEAFPERCEVARLPTGAELTAEVTAMDHTGRWVVGRRYDPDRAGSFLPVFVWKDGEVSDIVDLPGSEEVLNAVNSHGDAAGSVFEGTRRPVALIGGRVVRLPGDGDGEALAINDAGRIGGVLDGRPVVWESATAQPAPVPLPEGFTAGEVVGITGDGTVVFAAGDHPEGTGYLWFPDGRVRKLPAGASADPGGLSFWPEAVGGDWVAGRVFARDGEDMTVRPYRYDIATDTAQPLDDFRAPTAIGAAGWVPGTSGPGTGPVLAGPDDTVELPGYGTGQADYVVNGISDDGRTVAGFKVPTEGEVAYQPLIWRCS